ncbi:hypothetical protein KOW79_003632 [Hemibagrus wyckioides]|uniref:Receptor ligand binding region domain-containing protein n=1 Tax=Hemibagrus wyckioides TaxID=337641 RepID=A0A9D3P6U3_9TELE|nr:hypothetical protein KOW79_003632 [Hemibagrus wyckioides]
MDFREVRFARAMEFTIHEINNRTDLLPGITLGYQIYDGCSSVPMAIKVAFQLANGLELVFNNSNSCSKSADSAVTAVIGDSASTQSISIARVLGLFGIPQVSHYATCSCLSDKHQYPAFFRTIPSDQHQAAALARMVRHFGWTWIGALRSDTDYGNYGMASFLKAAEAEGICVEYSESYYRTQPRSKLERVANVIRRSTARVIIAFMASGDMRLLLEELSRQPPPPLQWIGSETWITDPDFLRYNMCAGAIGFGVPRSVIPGLREFLLDLTPAKALESPVLTEFWESSFSCYFKGRTENTEGARECDGSEDIRTLHNPYSDTSQLRITNMVYKATYAIAHAIHGLICNDIQCDKNIKLSPWQIFDQLKKVNFTTRNGFQVSFDSNGDPLAVYELINWQFKNDGALDFVTVGQYDSFRPRGQEFKMSKNISWVGGQTEVSHYATCACLSDKSQYPAFFRTIPSDHHQAAALARMVKLFGWTWIGAVRSDTDYGNNGMASFLKAAQEEGICVEYSEVYYRTQSRNKLERVANVIRRSTARVLIAFMHSGEMRFLLEELARQPPPPLQWIGSETWIIDPDFLRYNMCAGAVGFGVPQSVIPGLRQFLLELTPAQALKSPLLKEFWESSFNCYLKEQTDDTKGVRECDGSEDIHTLQNPYLDTSQLRVTNMVYKAAYAIAHAIHGLICNDTQCDKNIKFTPWQMLNQLKLVNFTTKNGFKVSFDSNGDPPAIYELINWQFKNDGTLDFVTVGQYDSSRPRGQEFKMSRNISWVGGQKEVCMDFRELRFARAMQFSIHEINNRTDILPGIMLGYQIHDSCSSVPMSIKVAFQFANGVEAVFNDTDSCSESAAVPAIIGESASTPSISMARTLGLFGIPQVSHYATCSCLSDKHQYPAFFRTIPSDQHQAAALARMVKHFGWTWIGAVRSDSDYGNYGMASFLKAAQAEGICVEYSEAYYRTQPRSKLERVANVIRRSTARVIVAFVASGDMRFLLEELARQPPPPLQWIGSETWVIEPELLRFNMCAGAIGFGIPKSVIPGFREFLLDLTPAEALKSPLLTEFWESSFSCKIKGQTDVTGSARQCDGREDIRALNNAYTDTSQLRVTNMVYKAAYAIAYAIHGLICNDTKCDKNIKFTPWQV